ncbi:hypothetical protein [Burkholderia oklahomensis]|uniref:hypothetical protein n=1 Tax=Burkholderia oklahomensis TaxID=342113 RepID=UPI0018DD0C9D|nr:hypothetical protein [Burkholderia oklahomensis]
MSEALRALGGTLAMPMFNVHWTVDGDWRMANDRWQTANGKRQTANGKRQTANGKRQTANGKRQTTHMPLAFRRSSRISQVAPPPRRPSRGQ